MSLMEEREKNRANGEKNEETCESSVSRGTRTPNLRVGFWGSTK